VKLYLYSPNTPSWRGAQLKHRDNFTFTFTAGLNETYSESAKVKMCMMHFLFRIVSKEDVYRHSLSSYLQNMLSESYNQIRKEWN
jgi:hypothetical protein